MLLKMSNVPAHKLKLKCLRRDYMAFMGNYDHDTDEYKHSCGEMQCPRHGRGACRQRYHQKKKALHPTWGFTTVILFLNHRPSSATLSKCKKVIRKHIKGWDRDAKICAILHPKEKCWHLNIGIQSKWIFRMKNLNWWSNYVEDRVTGYWDGKKYRNPKGRPRVADFNVMFGQLETEIKHLCANPTFTRRRPPRLKAGKFKNQPERWLWYVLRCKSGWNSSESLPRRMGYRLTSGFVVRRKKAVASSSDNCCPVPTDNSKEFAPWDRDALALWPEIAECAASFLADDGLMVAFPPITGLPDVIAALGHHLQYRWTLSLFRGDPCPLVKGTQIVNGWRPVLIYDKGRCLELRVRDALSYSRASWEKKFHPWEQNPDELLYLVEHLTGPGERVVDFFGGSFVAAVACRQLRRQYVGCDTDEGCVNIGRKRVADAVTGGSGTTQTGNWVACLRFHPSERDGTLSSLLARPTSLCIADLGASLSGESRSTSFKHRRFNFTSW